MSLDTLPRLFTDIWLCEWFYGCNKSLSMKEKFNALLIVTKKKTFKTGTTHYIQTEADDAN